MKRECGDCTLCCEGWLNTEIHGKRVYEGNPCYYFCDGCTIYENRPKDPCREYYCEWLMNEDFPEWLKPNKSKVIVTKKVSDSSDLIYYEIVEAGELIKSPILNWFIHWALKTKSNIIYMVQGKFHRLGSAKFTSQLEELSKLS